MSKKSVPNTKQKPRVKKLKQIGDITEYVLTSNNLRVLYSERKGTGVVTTNIVYNVGARDEAIGESGIAHMLEHMLFKPTTFDIARKTASAVMHFERQTGATINANTWKDRTTYYCAYPTEHFERALQIEAERMRGVVLTEKELKPEQTNVLSEHDMYAGDEQFSLSVEMVSTAFFSHPYGHETIGYRDDIASYTVPKLKRFYDTYYRPNNATLTVVGDISPAHMSAGVLKHFGHLEAGPDVSARTYPKEHPQEGLRTVTIERNTKTNILALGVKHGGFPTQSWYETMVTFDLLAGGKDSILYKKLIDAGKAVNIDTVLEPTADTNLGIIFITLAPKVTHAEMERNVRTIIASLTKKDIAPYLKKTIAKVLTQEALGRENSLALTAELVEYVSAGKWEALYETEALLKSITTTAIYEHSQKLFKNKNMTIGYFIGNQ